MKPAIIALCCALCGCTTIDRVNVLTVAVDCDVERGREESANGGGGASLVQQSGQVGAAFAGALESRITCRDGTVVEATVDGGTRELEQ